MASQPTIGSGTSCSPGRPDPTCSHNGFGRPLGQTIQLPANWRSRDMARQQEHTRHGPSPRLHQDCPGRVLLWEDRARDIGGTKMHPHRVHWKFLGLRDRSRAFYLMSISGSRAIPRRRTINLISLLTIETLLARMLETAISVRVR